MYESHLLNPVAPLTCTPHASHGETALTVVAADRSSKCKAWQLIRLIIITSHVQCQDFRSGCWRVLLYRFSALKCDLALKASTGGKSMSHKPNASDSYLFIHSVIPPCLLFFFSWVPQTHTCVVFTFSVALPVSPLQPRCPLMFGKLNDDRTVVKSLGGGSFFLFLHPSRLTHIFSWGRGVGGGWGSINLSWLPRGPPVNKPGTFAFPFTLTLSLCLPLLLHHFLCLCVFPHPFISLPLSPSFPFLLFTKQINLT